MLDFLLYFFATLQNDLRRPRAELGPIHGPKKRTFENRASGTFELLNIRKGTRFGYSVDIVNLMSHVENTLQFVLTRSNSYKTVESHIQL